MVIFFRTTGMIEPVRRVRARTKWSTTARAITALVVFACPGLPAYGQDSRASEAGNLPDAPGLAAPSVQNPSSPPASNDTGVISGTVLDTNNDVIQGAHVALSDHAGAKREMESGPDGQFAFSALAPGSYRVTVTGNGMGTFVSPWLTLHPGEIRIISQVVLPVARALTSITVNASHIEINQELADQQVQIAEEQRIWRVFPNFYSSYDWNALPMGPKQKFRLAFRSMMDPMAFAGAAGIAGFEHYYDT